MRTAGQLTPIRAGVLKLMQNADRSWSHSQLDEQLRTQGFALDKVTLYRTLEWLVSQGLAHRISLEERAVRYAAGALGNAPHLHFHCHGCDQVWCMPIPAAQARRPSLPTGFTAHLWETTAHGHCADCNTRY